MLARFLRFARQAAPVGLMANTRQKILAKGGALFETRLTTTIA